MNKKLRHLLYFIMLVGMFVFSAINVSAASSSIVVVVTQGKTANLAAVSESNAIQRATWTSSNKAVATVNRVGVVTGRSRGTAIISAKTGTQTVTMKVIVSPAITKVSLNKTAITITVGETYTLKGTVTPSNTLFSTGWKSSDKTIATVNTKGVVSGKKVGKTTVTFLAGEKSAKCTVTVQPKPAKKYVTTGTVSNSANGTALSGVTMNFRSGYDNKTGSVYAKTVSASNGSYSITLPEGKYTVQLSKSGFVTTYSNIESKQGTTGTGNRVDLSISPRLAEGQYRIVLSWGSAPRDLDAHVTGPLSTGGRFHVYFHNKTVSDKGQLVANLDVDDTSSYGPETVTINLSAGATGLYRYYIHDYSNRSSSNSTAMAKSGARVTVYKGNKQLATYNVPNKPGTKWHVFNIKNGKLVKVNSMGYETNPGNLK